MLFKSEDGSIYSNHRWSKTETRFLLILWRIHIACLRQSQSVSQSPRHQGECQYVSHDGNFYFCPPPPMEMDSVRALQRKNRVVHLNGQTDRQTVRTVVRRSTLFPLMPLSFLGSLIVTWELIQSHLRNTSLPIVDTRRESPASITSEVTLLGLETKSSRKI